LNIKGTRVKSKVSQIQNRIKANTRRNRMDNAKHNKGSMKKDN